MCGFSGINTFDPIGSSLIEQSLLSIKHRGPDNTLITDLKDFYAVANSTDFSKNKYGTPSGKTSSIWLGFNRLSIVDRSENAMQPFYDEKSETYFMMNGEIYNYMQLWSEHLQKEDFISQSDSEVAFKMYLKYGDEFVNYLQGMFAIVIYCKTDSSFTIFRDRLGIKPIYYTVKDDSFIFSSEIKGILATGLIESKPDKQAIAYSMYLGTCPSPLTIYRDIFSVRPGHKLTYSVVKKNICSEPYWTLNYSPNEKKIGVEEFQKDVINLCKLYSTGEVDKAIMLSGGIDSGTLAYFFGKTSENVQAFTIFQPRSPNNELDFAKDNAHNARLKLQAFEIPSKINQNEQLAYLSAEEEPNFIPEPTLFISEKAKQMGVRVLYNALGPDEIFGGYEYYMKINKIMKYDFIIKYIPAFLIKKTKRNKFKELQHFGPSYLGIITRAVFSWEEIKVFLKMDSIPLHPIEYIRRQIVTNYSEFESLPKLKQTSYLDIFYYISSHHSIRGDVPSMLHSIEMRFPFLEHTFIEKYFNQAHLFDEIGQYLKPVMQEYASDFLSDKVMNMPKKGFTIDVGQWLNNQNPQKTWYKKGLHYIFGNI